MSMPESWYEDWHEFEGYSVGFNAPEAAGVYWIRDGFRETIYIGKANNIADRLLEHLRDTGHCMHAFHNLEFWFRQIPDQVERENQEKIWIKQARPRCNKQFL